jgi:MoxR-like ATPase
MKDPQALYKIIQTETNKAIIGDENIIEHITIAILTNRHILLEGVPGVAKTTAVRLFARVSDLEYQRVQMTPDLSPSDVTGTRVSEQTSHESDLRRGPIFTDVLLINDINQASPKTQAALLESMREQTVTIGRQSFEIPYPFMLIATQNPLEDEELHTLPQRQRDCFLFKLNIPIPERSVERQILDRFTDTNRDNSGTKDIEPILDAETIEAARKAVRQVHVEDKLYEYLLNLIEATRSHQATKVGASPRASLALLHAAQARAAIVGRDYVIPEDLRALAEDTLNHRIVLNMDTDLSKQTPRDIIEDIIDNVNLPEADLSTELPGE